MFSKALHPATTEWLCYFFINSRFTNVCCRNNTRGGDGTKRGVEKVCPVSDEPEMVFLSFKVAKRKTLESCVNFKLDFSFYEWSFFT